MTDDTKKKAKMAATGSVCAIVGAKVGAGIGIAGFFGAIAGTWPVALVLGAAGATAVAIHHNHRRKRRGGESGL